MLTGRFQPLLDAFAAQPSDGGSYNNHRSSSGKGSSSSSAAGTSGRGCLREAYRLGPGCRVAGAGAARLVRQTGHRSAAPVYLPSIPVLYDAYAFFCLVVV